MLKEDYWDAICRNIAEISNEHLSGLLKVFNRAGNKINDKAKTDKSWEGYVVVNSKLSNLVESELEKRCNDRLG